MYICKMSYSSAMKKRYQLLKRVSIILIFFVLFTKMHAVEPQYAESQDIQKTETNVEVEEHPQDYIVIKIPFQAKYKPLFYLYHCSGSLPFVFSSSIRYFSMSESLKESAPPKGN